MANSGANVGVDEVTRLIAAASAGGNAVHLRGSESLAQILRLVAERFMDDHPGTLVSLAAGGTTRGIKAVIDGTSELGLASSAISDEQSRYAAKAKVSLRAHTIGRDNILALVHAGNPLPWLSLEQLRRIFAGRLVNWSELGGPDRPITVLVTDPGSGTAATWRERVLAGMPLSTQAIVVSEQESAVRVAADTGAISYRAEILPAAMGARPLALRTGQTPLIVTRDLVLVARDPAPPLVAQFIDWVTSPEGQRLMRISQEEQVGVVP